MELFAKELVQYKYFTLEGIILVYVCQVPTTYNVILPHTRFVERKNAASGDELILWGMALEGQ